MSLQDTRQTLLAYSEWLESQGMCFFPQHDNDPALEITNEQSVDQFMETQPVPEDVAVIDILKEAASHLASERDPGCIMTTAVLVFETSEMQDDQIMYEVNYSVITDSSLASAVGVLKVGSKILLDTATDYGDDDE